MISLSHRYLLNPFVTINTLKRLGSGLWMYMVYFGKSNETIINDAMTKFTSKSTIKPEKTKRIIFKPIFNALYE